MRIKENASGAKGSIVKKLSRFGLLLPYALLWYTIRFLRQNLIICYMRIFGRYGFRAIGKNVVLDGFPEFIWPCADIRLKDDVRIGKRCVFQGSPDSKILINRRVTINDGCYITSLFSISIGENTSIGEYTSIRDYNHKFDDVNKSIKSQDYVGASIDIGSDCWIGRGCIILPGVTIGQGAVIGANSVVTKDVLPYTVVAGVPAKYLKSRTQVYE